MTSSESAAFRARTRLLGLLLALVGAGLTGLAVVFKPPFLGTLALLIVIVGAFWVGRRHLMARFSRDPAPPPSR